MFTEIEVDLLVNTVDEAVAHASVGRVAGGYEALVLGLSRARAAEEDGEEWAAALVLRYRLALDNYCDSYGVRMG
jgi:hypothetical protein